MFALNSLKTSLFKNLTVTQLQRLPALILPHAGRESEAGEEEEEEEEKEEAAEAEAAAEQPRPSRTARCQGSTERCTGQIECRICLYICLHMFIRIWHKPHLYDICPHMNTHAYATIPYNV